MEFPRPEYWSGYSLSLLQGHTLALGARSLSIDPPGKSPRCFILKPEVLIYGLPW